MSPRPQALFSSSLISPEVQAQLPEGYLMRPLEITDYAKGYYDCLAGLTVVGKVSEQSFCEAFEAMLRCRTVYHVVVIEELAKSRIVATGTLIVEQKFLRGCAKAGHIEDIVVHDSQRGKKFGIRLIDQLRHIGATVGCYKLLLTCSESNEAFYEKSGFHRKDLHMSLYFNQQQPQPQPSQEVIQAFSLSTTSNATTTTATTTTSISNTPKQYMAMPASEPICNTTNVDCSLLENTLVAITTSSSSSSNSFNSTTSHGSKGPASAPAPASASASASVSASASPLSSSKSINGHGVPLEALGASMESIYVK